MCVCYVFLVDEFYRPPPPTTVFFIIIICYLFLSIDVRVTEAIGTHGR